MTTVINNPGEHGANNNNNDGGGSGLIIGVLVSLVLIALFFIYILPMIRANNTAQPQTPAETNINVTIPKPDTTGGTTGAATGASTAGTTGGTTAQQ